MAENQILSLPAAATGLTPASSATAWLYGSWVEASASLGTKIYVIGLAFQITNTPASLDTTYAQLFEIGIGAAASEVTKIQIPYSYRADTVAYGYYRNTLKVFLPEPYEIPAGTRVAVRATDSIASAITYNGVKIIYREGAVSAQAWEKTLSETVTLADSYTKSSKKLATDAITLAEIITLLANKKATDEITLADVKTLLANKNITDAITLSEIRTLLTSKIFGDTITLSDIVSILTKYYRTLTDDITASDSLLTLTNYYRTLTDTITSDDNDPVNVMRKCFHKLLEEK